MSLTWSRRAKQMLLEQELPKMEKLVRKGKNVTKEIIDDRTAKVGSTGQHRAAALA